MSINESHGQLSFDGVDVLAASVRELAPAMAGADDVSKVRSRVVALLSALSLQSDLRVAVMLVLLEPSELHPHPALAAAGLPFGTCGTTKRIFDRVGRFHTHAPAHIDREARDAHIGPLVAPAGLLERWQVPKASERQRLGRVVVKGWPYGNNNSWSGYAVSGEVTALLEPGSSEEEFRDALEVFVSGTEQREELVRRAEARRAVPQNSTHSQLIRAAVAAQLSELARQGDDFICTYIDDAGGQRVPEARKADLIRLGLLPDANSRFPDALLVNEKRHEVWVVDAVTSDGEVDELRAADFIAMFSKRGWVVAGFTTAYTTFARMVGRQEQRANLATHTNLWIAQDGGRWYALGRSRRYGA